MIGFLSGLADSFWGLFFLNALLQSVLFSATVLLIGLLVRRWVMVKHAVLFVGLAGLVVIPMLSVLLAGHSVPLFTIHQPEVPEVSTSSRDPIDSFSLDTSSPILGRAGEEGDTKVDDAAMVTVLPALDRSRPDPAPVTTARSWSPSWVTLVGTFWLVGLAWGVFGLVRSYLQLRSILNESDPLSPSRQRLLAEELCERMGISAIPPIVVSH